mmetsp:Transcript_37306/g.61347  ORF Transcript_37306/g.61347 Transcript_37306/m.61347 type:complete len:89 (+) Transcript_37306:2-268(+)
MNSILFWFCKHVKQQSLMLRHQNGENKYDDGTSVKQERFMPIKMKHARWCHLSGEVVDLWQQNATSNGYMPEYRNEQTRCYQPIVCPL